ncbi:bifunctional hydroxymethylpyrimidine kinase/phosphomethylpyrimidine kinase [Sulfurovum sp. NBC37-1]|uniref:bifunctional hydroxymethylpyrimidine kinase/phosphomethylpyrimidine kinase n=1 Tax=Sulfurovum sp. (strain NBC37-1) TaxID=387093 RepID=UPI0001587556|nr:bifunctional hydroxymethylpyrimidine kinase/phosphomethylpyrimidine kinase [Sulfurovum sp. NBC37-1]BAF71491.1 phosphomethylpyrimidine kinase [Sulfurovum sp. NBC37-1]
MGSEHTPTVLTIAGFDPYGGAGVVMDVKTIHALGGYALSSVTAVTAQNSTGVKSVHNTAPEILRAQLEVLLDDISVDAVKIGMLADKEVVQSIVEIIQKYDLKNIVLDTVLVSSSGRQLIREDAVEVMKKELFPLVDLITPNIPEVNTLQHHTYSGKESETQEVAQAFFDLGVNAVLLKGGHSEAEEAIDHLVQRDGTMESFAHRRIDTTHTHGTGCLLSSAVATGLAKGLEMNESVSGAKDFLSRKLEHADELDLQYHTKNEEKREPIF